MKQYDSYLIYGCHFPSECIDIITANTSIIYFNSKIKNNFNCEIVNCNVPILENKNISQYFLRICIDQSEQSIFNPDDIKAIDLEKYYNILDIFNLEKKSPYLIAVPIIRELPD